MPGCSLQAHASRSIGMFDSGLGGLTVLRALKDKLPQESIVYYGDTARLPYGQKSREAIVRYSIENAVFLLEKQVKVLIVACNTASAIAIDRLKTIFNIPVIGVIEPSASQAVATTRSGKIAVMGTKGTIASGAYQKEICRLLPEASVYPIACPLLVPLVEEGLLDHPATAVLLEEYLDEALCAGVDTILLGCTHYPLLINTLRQIVDPSISIIDSAGACAAHVSSLMKLQGLHKEDSSSPHYHYYVSDDPEKFAAMGLQFLGHPIDVHLHTKELTC